jgi:hypothetical protein
MGATLIREHLKVADSSKGWMAAYMLQAVPKNIFATLRCSPLITRDLKLIDYGIQSYISTIAG